MKAEDNPYIITLAPDEFHEVLSEYENYVEWAEKSMQSEQKEVVKRVLARLHEADTLHVCLDEVDQIPQGNQEKQFTRDDVARILATTLNTVLGKLPLSQIVQGIAMLPAGNGVYLIDVVIKNVATESTWGVYVIVQLDEEKTDESDALNKEFPMTSITRADIMTAGFSEAVVEKFTDSDMQHINGGYLL